MIAKLYHIRTPDGRSLLVAKALHEVSPRLGSDAIRVAIDLFSCAHPKEKAVTVVVEALEKLAALEEVCGGCGIAVAKEVVPDSSAR